MLGNKPICAAYKKYYVIHKIPSGDKRYTYIYRIIYNVNEKNNQLLHSNEIKFHIPTIPVM